MDLSLLAWINLPYVKMVTVRNASDASSIHPKTNYCPWFASISSSQNKCSQYFDDATAGGLAVEEEKLNGQE